MKISLNPYRDEKKDIDYLPSYVERKVKRINEMIELLCTVELYDSEEFPYYAYKDFCILVRENVELFDTLHYVARQIIGRFPTQDEEIDVLAKIIRNGSVTQILFDRLVPLQIPGYYLNESVTEMPAFCNALLAAYRKNELENTDSEGKDESRWINKHGRYSCKVVLCFIHHLSDGRHPIGFYGYALKQIIDSISLLFLYGDGPKCVAYYCEEEIGGDKDYSEIFIVPYMNFPDYLKHRKAMKNDGKPKEQMDGFFVMDKFRKDVDKLTKGLLLPQVRRVVDVVKENKDINAMKTETLALLKQCADLVKKAKMAMHQSNIGSVYDAGWTYSEINARLDKRNNYIRITLNDLIERREKGFTSKTLIEYPEYHIKGTIWKDYTLNKGMEYTVCFRHHYGPKRRLHDHDNMETLPYYALITHRLPRHIRDSSSVFMDAVTEDESTYSEIIIMPDERFKGPESM